MGGRMGWTGRTDLGELVLRLGERVGGRGGGSRGCGGEEAGEEAGGGVVGDGRGVVAEELVVEGLELEDDPALVVVVADHAGLNALVVDGDGSEIWWLTRGEGKRGKVRGKSPCSS